MAIMAILIYNNASVCTGACWFFFFVQGMLGVKIAFPEVIVFKAIACHEPPLPHPQFSEGLTYKKKKHISVRESGLA